MAMTGECVKRAGVLALACVLLLLSAARDARAQDCSDQAAPAKGQGAFTTLALLDARGCLGGEADTTPLAAAVGRQLRRKPAIAANAVVDSPLADAIDLLLAHTAGPHAAGDAALFTELARQLTATRDALGTFAPPAVPASWQITQGQVSVISGSLQQRVDAACAEGGAGCAAAFERVREAMRVINLTRRVLHAAANPVLQAHVDETTRRLRQWGHYFDTARSQYAWELALNALLMRDDRPKDAAGVPQGFRSVPRSQWMLLHPSVSFEFDKGAPPGQKLEAAVVIDVLGYNRWAWRADGSMGRALGVSLITAIGDRASGHYVGWGGMVHLNHTYSVGFTVRRGGEKAFLLTADVAKLWTRVPEPLRERIAGGR